jgi:prefoldin subunit 5
MDILPYEHKEFIDVRVRDAREALVEISSLEISTQDDVEFATRLIRELKSQRKDLEEERSKVTKHLTQALETVRGWFRPAVRTLEEAETILRGKIVALSQLQAARQAEALRAATTSEEVSEVMERSVVPAEGSHMTYTWDFEIVDFSKVPRQFLCVNEDAVLEHIKKTEGKEEISGIRVTRKGTLVVRSSRS